MKKFLLSLSFVAIAAFAYAQEPVKTVANAEKKSGCCSSKTVASASVTKSGCCTAKSATARKACNTSTKVAAVKSEPVVKMVDLTN